MSLTPLLIPTYTQMLKALSAWLDKAQAQLPQAEAQALREGLAPDALGTDPDRSLELGLPNGMTFDLTAEQYARDWALAQFYFHLMTAYAILRSRHIELGKADYVPHMLAYLRPGTVPEG